MKRIAKADMKKLLLFAVAAVLMAGPALAQSPAPHSKVTLDLLLSMTGTGAYVLGYALSDICKKHHHWLAANPVDTFGTTDNLRLMEKRSAKERENTIFIVGDGEFADATAGKPPFKTKHPIKLITHLYERQGAVFVTLSKNIKTYKDMIGKRVALAAVGHGLAILAEDMLKTWGIMDKVKIARMGLPDMPKTLIDGSVDVAMLPLDCLGGKWFLSPAFTEITNPIYFVSWTQEFADKWPDLTGHNRPSAIVPPGAFGPTQTEAIGVISVYNSWGCYPEVNPEIPYEIAKVINEKADLFASYHAKGKSVPFIGMDLAKGPFARKDFHASALKYFDEVGIKIPK